MSEILTRVQDTAIRGISSRIVQTIDDAELKIRLPFLSDSRDDVVKRFIDNMTGLFSLLAGKTLRAEQHVNFETLTLVEEHELEIMVAVEGMIAAARNEHLPHFISFNTRLNALLATIRIDESSNPLDPLQITTAFQDALKPLGLSGNNILEVYRVFNRHVLRELNTVLHDANQILIDHGVIPNLGLEGARQNRPAGARSAPRDASEVTGFGVVPQQREPQAEMFSLMQNLLHQDKQPSGPQPDVVADPGPAELESDAPEKQFMVPTALIRRAERDGAVSPPFTPATGQDVQTLDQNQLISILSNIQRSMESAERAREEGAEPATRPNIAESLGSVLTEQGKSGIIQAIDRHSSDVINLVTMLYEAIWQDDSVPVPIKELIGLTQITIIKVALSDTTFFNLEDHPARTVLNEFAAAGIGWAEVEKLEEDPLYKKMQTLVHRIADDFESQPDFFELLLKDFRTFRARESARERKLEQRILKAQERQERLEDIKQLVSQKIEERVLGRDLHTFVRELLDGPFHKFMVLLVVKEGPGGSAWKQAINTIDVLLWSVQKNKQSGDQDRLETVNPRLLNNLRKAFRIAQLEPEEIDALVTRLREVQAEMFIPELTTVADPTEVSTAITTPAPDATFETAAAPGPEREVEGPDEAALDHVDNFTVGIWVEFLGEAGNHLRCKLAAKINAIDKFIFVNRQGVKVVEKTRDGLARELEEGTVRVISDGLLFSRALESVIGTLRDTQTAQQTGSAYQPQFAQAADKPH